MAVNVYYQTIVLVNPSSDPDFGTFINSPRESVLKHHLAVFKTCLGGPTSSNNFGVYVYQDKDDQKWLPYCGLGSTSASVLGLYHGLNNALEKPFKTEELRQMLAWNYVEEGADDKTVTYGYVR